MHLYDIIKRPVITEKSTKMADTLNQYVFEVDLRANKIQIADAVVRIFDVDVVKVRTMVMPAKRGLRMRRFYRRQSSWKKAIVTIPVLKSRRGKLPPSF
ncbi:MAG: 50S ribosomal protein L23 [Anaerolineae bacterium]|nr:50S ribosomal protein L23 [Anaerolineae bacterium]